MNHIWYRLLLVQYLKRNVLKTSSNFELNVEIAQAVRHPTRNDNDPITMVYYLGRILKWNILKYSI